MEARAPSSEDILLTICSSMLLDRILELCFRDAPILSLWLTCQSLTGCADGTGLSRPSLRFLLSKLVADFKDEHVHAERVRSI